LRRDPASAFVKTISYLLILLKNLFALVPPGQADRVFDLRSAR
jgi:hypothetical protein